MRVLFVAITALLLSGCCRKGVTQQSARLDSVRVVHDISYIERVRDTTIYVTIPNESMEAETKRDSSTLETSVARSRARINPDGTLYHTLENKPVKLSTPVSIKDTERHEKRDSIVYRDNYVVDTVIEKHIPKSYWWFMGIAILTSITLLYKVIRGLKKI